MTDKLEFTDAERREIGIRNKGLTPDEFEVFMAQVDRYQLNPLANQIYAQKHRSRNGPDRMTLLTGIDGYRLLADRTGLYAGSDDAAFVNGKNFPTAATVTVWKLVGAQRCPFTATARWTEYYPGDKKGHMWIKMPHVMLAKVAEALALRKGFPAELAGVYVKEELDQAADSEPKPDAKPANPRSNPVQVEGGPPPQTTQEADAIKRKDDIFQEVHARILNVETGEKLLNKVLPFLRESWKDGTLSKEETLALLPHVLKVGGDVPDADNSLAIGEAVADLKAELKGKPRDGSATDTAKQADEVF